MLENDENQWKMMEVDGNNRRQMMENEGKMMGNDGR